MPETVLPPSWVRWARISKTSAVSFEPAAARAVGSVSMAEPNSVLR